MRAETDEAVSQTDSRDRLQGERVTHRAGGSCTVRHLDTNMQITAGDKDEERVLRGEGIGNRLLAETGVYGAHMA